MAREIDRKLRLTAALLGTVTRKDLYAAFRRVNASTPFDVERANKWLQGRARPRERQLYADWAKVLELEMPGQWIAECDSETFLDAICSRHQRDRETLRRQAESAATPRRQPENRDPPLVGIYACYSHAWSPYFRGQLIRGELTIAAAQRLSASYAETLPTGRLRLDGVVSVNKRALHVDVREAEGDAHFTFCLFPPAPPVSVLAGFMCGATVIGPEVQPSVTRIVMVRLAAQSTLLRDSQAYLAPQASVAEDLAAMGMAVTEPAQVDQKMAAFLVGGEGGGVDQIAGTAYRALVDLLDRSWLVSMANTAGAGSDGRSGAVSLAERRVRGR